MKKRNSEEKNRFLLTQEKFKISTSLKKELNKYIKTLNYLLKEKSIPYTIMILKTTQDCIKELRNNIRSTDIVFKIPKTTNYYAIILQNTSINNAIEVGSRISSLVKREFMINKKVFFNQIALFGIEQKSIKASILAYEITLYLDKKEIKNDENLWKIIKRF